MDRGGRRAAGASNGQRGVQAGQTERVEAAGIAWETEVYRQAPAGAPRAGEAHLAELRVEGARAAAKASSSRGSSSMGGSRGGGSRGGGRRRVINP